MREYGNFYAREDLGVLLAPALENFNVVRFIKTALSKFPNDSLRQRNWLENVFRTHYWPVSGKSDFLDLAGLSDRTEEKLVAKGVYSKQVLDISSNNRIEVRAFYEEDNQRWFYWWDLSIESKFVKSALEFFPWNNHPASYVLFASDATQTPLMCTEQFKTIRKY